MKPRHRPTSEARGLGGQYGKRRPMLDRAGAGPMWRCKYPREFHQLAATSICGGLAFATDRERHLRECHNVDALPVLVDEMFEAVATDERQEHGKYGRKSHWCWCGTRKPIEDEACATCHNQDKYDRANRVMSTTREGLRSKAAQVAYLAREQRRRDGVCVQCGGEREVEERLHCKLCLDKAAERKAQYKRQRSGTGDGA